MKRLWEFLRDLYKHYRHDKLPSGLHRDTFVASGDTLAPKLDALDDYMREHASGPLEAMVLLNSLLEIYKQIHRVEHISTSENPPQ